MSQSTGKKVYYLESPVTGWAQMPYNTKEVLTESGEWESPITGWIKVTCIGGGQAGASIRNNGSTGLRAVYFGAPGDATSFGPIVAKGGVSWLTYLGGGGAAGEVVTAYLPMIVGEKVSYLIGAGGVAVNSAWSGDTSLYCSDTPGGPTNYGAYDIPNYGYVCAGGNGATNGSSFGGGGGGASFLWGKSAPRECYSPGGGGGKSGDFLYFSSTTPGTDVLGGDGGPGCVILEYADPKKKS